MIMRKILHALCAVALVSLTAAAAHAAEKTRLERLDVHGNPTLKFYVSVTDSDGRVVTGRNKEDLSIVVDSAEQGAAVQLQTFEETKDPVNLVVVVGNGPAMQSVLEDVKRGIAALADSLPPKSKMAVIAFASDYKRIAELGAPVEAESAAKTMAIESEGTEEHMLQAVRTAIGHLGQKPAWPA